MAVCGWREVRTQVSQMLQMTLSRLLSLGLEMPEAGLTITSTTALWPQNNREDCQTQASASNLRIHALCVLAMYCNAIILLKLNFYTNSNFSCL